MKKQKKQMLILLIVCLIAVGGFFFLQKADLEKTETKVSDEVKLQVFDAEKITQLKVTGSNDLYFTKKDGVWYSVYDESLVLDQGVIHSLVRNLQAIYTDVVIENPEDLAQYQLDSPPMKIKLVIPDGSDIIEIWVGLKNEMTNGYYIQIVGDSNVYLVDGYVIGACEKKLEEFLEEDAEAGMAE